MVFDVHKYRLEISRHAYEKAAEEDIPKHWIKATIYGGAKKEYGKNYVEFKKTFKKDTIRCVGEKKGQCLKIITITRN